MVGWAGCSDAAVLPEESPGPPQSPRYASGRILVKLTPTAAQQVEAVDLEGNGITAEQLPIEPLRAVSQQYQVVRWKRLIAKRSGEGNDPVGMGRIYLLVCDPRTDVKMAVGAFSRLKELVEYAEPDYMVQTQNPKPLL